MGVEWQRKPQIKIQVYAGSFLGQITSTLIISSFFFSKMMIQNICKLKHKYE